MTAKIRLAQDKSQIIPAFLQENNNGHYLEV